MTSPYALAAFLGGLVLLWILLALAGPEERTSNQPWPLAPASEWRRAIPRGLVGAAVLMAVVIAILLAGTSTAAPGPSAFALPLCDQRPHPVLEWGIDNPSTSDIAAVLYVDGAPVRHLTIRAGTMHFAFKRFEHRHWVMVTGNGFVLLSARIRACVNAGSSH